MHYLHGRPANDTSGLRLRLSGAAVPYSAGMVAFASSFRIPPRTPSTCVPNACCYEGWEPLHGFAARVHTHALGREVRLDAAGRPSARAALEQVLSLDPQKPQVGGAASGCECMGGDTGPRRRRHGTPLTRHLTRAPRRRASILWSRSTRFTQATRW